MGFMEETAPVSAHDAYQRLLIKYHALMSSGNYQPMLEPWAGLGVFVTIAYLLFDHRQSRILRLMRLPVWLFNLGFSLYTVIHCRGRTPSAALGVGMLSAWSTVWTLTFLVLDDGQADYLRIEKRINDSQVKDAISTGEHANGIAGGKSSARQINGEATQTNRGQDKNEVKSIASTQKQDSVYYWQPYPLVGWKERLDWVLDIFTTFRGHGWNWRVSGLPSIPPAIMHDLNSTTMDVYSEKPTKPSLFRTSSTRAAVVRHNIYIFMKDYLILDLIKTLMVHDPYFWGDIHTTRPPTYLPPILRCSHLAIRMSRILISLGILRFALEIIFSLGPIFFVGILGPKRMSVRGEAWLYPDQFGSLSAVFEKGLAGWWGAYWHQTFRKGFETPGASVVRLMGLEPKSTPARTVQLFVAFGISGCIHACGSYTLLLPTNPLGPASFFLIHAVGISVQMALVAWLHRIGVTQRVPRRIRRWSNFFFTHIFMYYTAGLLVDDFCQGGLWLFEPIPVSILRGPLGLGAAEDTWWRWGGTLVWWHKGEHWWQSGIAL
ncbi:hypothetical protein K461DRAFT_279925 [Myriangium duriaei CBS 260.36]|uniref:Wax synthase domain-containing protein n=1 Tax=Myriangium duriaei CBS 260.36 TaxID=1168546 RepID=A0A9P4IWX1_9PEZI|nr:hypothetical protein K461DRAFT_279925 [Myriangium duriaei CBS 260.36]